MELQILDLTCNKLESIPVSSLAGLAKLEQLLLSGNKITEISEDICNIASLEVLHLFLNHVDVCLIFHPDIEYI